MQQPKQVARRLYAGKDLFRQGHAEAAFEARQQLDPAQTVETEVALKPAVERDPGGLALAWPQILRQLRH